jgi:hypothetical protein
MPCDLRLRSREFSAILDGFHAGVPSTCWATSSSGSTPPQAPAVSYRIPVVGTGYRFAAGHRLGLRLVLASDDQDPNFPTMMTFRYASVGTSSLNRVAATSRLLLPPAAGKL